MSATESNTNGWAPYAPSTSPIKPSAPIPLQASSKVGRGQFATLDSSGNAALNDGTVPALICAGVGFPETISDSSSVAGAAVTEFWHGVGSGNPMGTGSDAFTAADQGTPFFIADENTLGKLSNSGGNDRSFGGVVFGLDKLGAPIFGSGPFWQAIARMIHALTNEVGGSYGYAADATASTDQGSLSGSALSTIGFVIPRAKRRGLVTSVEIIPSAALSATGGTDYRRVKIWKVDTTGGVAIAASPLVATLDVGTQALVAGQPTAFTLGAASALLLRETDILVGTSVHAGSGATIPQSAIRANAKVI